MPSNWLAFDRIRAMARQHSVFQAERVFQDQSSLDRLTAGGEFLDFNSQSAILDQTNLQINRLERYKDYEQMDQTGEISLALDLYADEACLTGDTRIPLLDGTCPTIAELSERNEPFWVYSFDQENNKYVPAEAHSARVTGRNVPIVKVTLDDGSSIRCTSDHLFMLNDGSFVEAGDLQPSDSLKPLYKKTRYRGKNGRTLFDEKPYPTATGYEYFYNGKNFTSTHRWVYHHLNNDQPEVVHHVDYQSLNNEPNNLKGVTELEHREIHARFGADNTSFNQITWDEVLPIVEDWHGPMRKSDVYSALGVGERVLNRLLNERGITWKEFKKQYNRCSCCDSRLSSGWVCGSCRKNYLQDYHQQKLTEESYRERRKKNKRISYQSHEAVKVKSCRACKQTKDIDQFEKNKCAYSPYCNECRPTACPKRYKDKSFGNHSVVSVEQCGIADEVYDISVPNYHCFAAGAKDSWVIVHNSLVDPERKHTLIIRARNKRLKTELEDFLFNTLQWDTYCRPTVRYLCKYGDMPYEIVLNKARDGVASLRFMNVYNFTRIETRYGDLVGFFYMDAITPEPQFFHPWQVMHTRLTSFENIYHPYGRSILDGGRKAFKQLRLMEDAALIYRITRAPEKRKFTIPVGLIPAKEVPEYMQMIARNFKRQRFYNPSTGAFDERYSPLIQEDDFFLPRRPDGQGPDVDVLPGAENLDQIADIEYFKKKMIAPTKIPFSRVGIGEGGGESNEKSLSQSHSEFAKAVQWVQREVATGLTKVAIVHLALRGYSVEDLKGFEIALTATSAMEELYRIETWQTRVGVMADLKDLGWFPKEWIVTHFTDLSPDEIEELKEMEGTESSGGPGGGIPGGLDDLSGEEGGLPPEEGGLPTEEGDMPEIGGMAPSPDEDAGDIPIEGFDYAAEQRLILELRKQGKMDEKGRIVKKWAARMGRFTSPSDREFSSGFQHVLESKELDGLTTDSSPHSESDGQVSSIRDPNEDNGLLVEWSVDCGERNSAIQEVYNVLMAEEGRQTVEDEEEMITEEDIPISVSHL